MLTPSGDACLSQIEMLIKTVRILQTLPTTVKDVAETAARQRKAKYDIATPAAQEMERAVIGRQPHCIDLSTCTHA